MTISGRRPTDDELLADASAPDAELLVDELIDIASLVPRFGEVERATLHPDGVTPETDTTHTLMLALCAMKC